MSVGAFTRSVLCYVVLVIVTALLPVRAAAAMGASTLISYGATVWPTTTTALARGGARRAEPEAHHGVIEDDGARRAYHGASNTPAAACALRICAYDGALELADRHELRSCRPLYDAAEATTAAEGAEGLGLTFSQTTASPAFCRGRDLRGKDHRRVGDRPAVWGGGGERRSGEVRHDRGEQGDREYPLLVGVDAWGDTAEPMDLD